MWYELKEANHLKNCFIVYKAWSEQITVLTDYSQWAFERICVRLKLCLSMFVASSFYWPRQCYVSLYRHPVLPQLEEEGYFVKFVCLNTFSLFAGRVVRESKRTFSSNKQMQEIPDSGWQNLVNNGWFLNVDGLRVHLTVSGALAALDRWEFLKWETPDWPWLCITKLK